MVTLNTVLSEISDLSLDEKEMVEDILHKRIIEERREEIYSDYQHALKDYKEGKYKSGSVEDLIKDMKESK